MNDEQIEYMVFLLNKTKAKVFLVDNETLIPVVGFKEDHTDTNDPTDTIPEPVVFLGGNKRGQCVALWACGIDEFEVVPDIAIWPQ